MGPSARDARRYTRARAPPRPRRPRPRASSSWRAASRRPPRPPPAPDRRRPRLLHGRLPDRPGARAAPASRRPVADVRLPGRAHAGGRLLRSTRRSGRSGSSTPAASSSSRPRSATGASTSRRTPARSVAVNEKTGKRAWKYVSRPLRRRVPGGRAARAGVRRLPEQGRPATAPPARPGLDGEVIDFGVGFGQHALDAGRSGRARARRLQIAKALIVGDWNGDVWAFQRGTGRADLALPHRRPVKGGIAYRDKRFYVGSYDGHVYCLSLDGKLIWRSAAQGTPPRRRPLLLDPAVAYGRVYIGSTDGKVYSFGAATGKLRWSREHGRLRLRLAGRRRRRSSSSARTRIASTPSTPPPACRAGRSRRTARSPARRPSSGASSTSRRSPGRTYALDARTGKQVWTFPDGEYSPVVAVPGRFFLVGQGDDLWDGSALMRYLVTGAAGFVGSHLAETLERGRPRGRRRRLLHRLLRRRREGAQRGRPRRPRGSTSPRTPLDLDGVDGVFHLAGQPGRAQLRRRLPASTCHDNLLATQRVFEAGRRRRRPRRLRLLVVGLRRGRDLPDAGGHRCPARSRPTG